YLIVRYKDNSSWANWLISPDYVTETDDWFTLGDSRTWETQIFALKYDEITNLKIYFQDTDNVRASGHHWGALDFIKIVSYDYDTFTVTVQDLSFTTPTLTEFSGDQYRFDVASETYTDTLFNITIDDSWAGVNVQDGDLIEVNNTAASHAFTVYSVSREPFTGSNLYYFLEDSQSGSYTIVESGETEVRSYTQEGELIPFETWTVYVNGSRIYNPVFEVADTSHKINVTLEDV
ncbi:unnamed protein product, partial [marine sediment metagenome]